MSRIPRVEIEESDLLRLIFLRDYMDFKGMLLSEKDDRGI